MYIAVSISVVKHSNNSGWHKRTVETTVSIIIVYNFSTSVYNVHAIAQWMEVSETTCLEASGPSRQELLSAKESEKNRIKSENFPPKITVSGPEYGLWLKNLNVA